MPRGTKQNNCTTRQLLHDGNVQRAHRACVSTVCIGIPLESELRYIVLGHNSAMQLYHEKTASYRDLHAISILQRKCPEPKNIIVRNIPFHFQFLVADRLLHC